ncbi:hypothetical protein DAEQUDRAFT_528389 [Daedalea quercina L-15889]|uniref:Uncharacterized protein n=1 Tax=Daedalea quercina L-15889 TaxID=1314783 RepID=A0A165MA57_9APHY|nr:hypothetical protein DAEQUDRAFT_528389 [Daedalea quercina L-15889]
MIDPQDLFVHHSIIHPTSKGGSANAKPLRLSPFQHYHNIFSYSCVVCRINYPFSSHGLASAKRPFLNPWFGQLMTCKEHRKSSFCGICLREAPTMEGEAEYAQGLSVCAVENEDDQTWPGVDTTCRMCRKQWIWLSAKHDTLEREAVGGGPQLATDDWETRQAIEAFADLGEGMIKDVLELAKEKYWYKVNTKLSDMLSQALAASKFAGRVEGPEGYVSEDELSEEEDEDAELVSITEDAAGIRELAITDFARNRILDGHWVNPTDEFNMRWVSTSANTPRAQHPCPWNAGSVFDGALEEGEGHTDADGGELAHPRPKTIAALRPPTYNISSMAYQAYVKQFRDIVYPAMQNVVRRLAAECTADGKDPVAVAREMSVDDVARALRDEAVWRTGVDWLEWRANQDRRRRREKEKDDDAESTSSRSSESHMTSPGLSTTTLQTTPSPPPSSVKDDDAMSSPVSALPPALESGPIHKSPQLMHPIPYVPLKVSHLPEYSIGTFRSAWQSACAPLYQCYCSICQRRILQASTANNAPAAAHDDVAAKDVAQVPQEVQVESVRAEEEESDDDDDDEEEEDEDGESELEMSEYEVVLGGVTPRKRSSQELDVDADVDAKSDAGLRGGSPPKRARMEGSFSPSMVPMTPSPGRLRKRSSEDLDEDDDAVQGNGEHKRSRTESHPQNMSASAELVA